WVFPLLALVAYRTRASAIPWLLGAWVAAGVAWMFFLLHRYSIPIFGTSQEDILQYGDRVHATTMCRSAGIACGLFASWARVLQPQSMEKPFPPWLLTGAIVLLSCFVLSVPEFMGYPTNVAYLGMSHVGVSA